MVTRSEITLLKSLQHKKYRSIHSQFIIEGTRIVEEALTGSYVIDKVYISETFGSKLREQNLLKNLSNNKIKPIQISEYELTNISGTVNSQGIIAVLNIPKQAENKSDTSSICIYLDGIQDPGNMGTILRTVTWFGIKSVYLSLECVDIYNPKVLRAGMGAHFHTAIVPNFSIDAIKKSGYTIVAADQNGSPIGEFDNKSALPICLVLGSEAHGISDQIKPYVEYYVSVPGKGEIDSLNVTVAGGILLHYFTK